MQADNSKVRIGTIEDFEYTNTDELTRAQFKQTIVDLKCVHSPPFSVPIGRTADRERADLSHGKDAFMEIRKKTTSMTE